MCILFNIGTLIATSVLAVITGLTRLPYTPLP